MKITIYGPMPDGQGIAAILAVLPADAKEVVVQAPPRRAVDLRACQRPNWLEYTASVDNKIFIHMTQEGVDKPYGVKVC